MLVLSRRESEKILVPELGITLEVLSIKGNTVRLGIDAPREIRVLRGEIVDTELEAPFDSASSNSHPEPCQKSNMQPLRAYVCNCQVRPGHSDSASAPQPCAITESQPIVNETRSTYQVCT